MNFAGPLDPRNPSDPDPLDRQDEVPNPARMYDWVLGGAANFAVDRRAGEKALAVNPDGRLHARANRAFLRRVVRHLAQQGIDQFLDLGSGVPTVDHVHQVAQRVNPAARVVYVDSDPVASAYGASLLARDRVPGAAMVRAELADLVSAYRDTTAPGSYLAITHMTADHDPAIRDLQRLYQHTTMPFRTRTAHQVEALFGGYRLEPPGVVPVSDWHPDPGPDPNRATHDAFIGGLAQQP
jgi:hypothetical protein